VFKGTHPKILTTPLGNELKTSSDNTIAAILYPIDGFIHANFILELINNQKVRVSSNINTVDLLQAIAVQCNLKCIVKPTETDITQIDKELTTI